MSKLLLIDDDKIVTNIYRNKFSVEGFKVEIAHDGREGLDLVSAFKPDVVILDLMLPKMSGVQVLTAIRALPDCQKLPIIVFSNTYLTNAVQEAWKAGATKCLSKSSCSPTELVKLVQSILAAPPTGKVTVAPPPSDKVREDVAKAESDTSFLTDMRQSFIESLPSTLTTLRAQLRELSKSNNETDHLKQLKELCRKVHSLTGNAGIAAMQRIAQFADALEALLKELSEKPKNINPSTLRTVANAVDFLGVLFEPVNFVENHDVTPANILVVDDEELSRRAVTHALEKAKLPSVNVEDPLVALKLLSENSYDLVLLDIDMPGMNGFELCAKLRALPAHKKTPVLFVTSLSDFETRANSTMSGANDLIAKPFLFMELAVKSMVYVLRGRLATNK